MKTLLLAGFTLAVLCCVKGNYWKEYEEAIKHYSEEELNQEHPGKIRPEGYKHPTFKCPDMSPSPSIPTSVERVKAADIKVIAALGDSLTTAIAANASTFLGVPIEYRHVSFSIGGHGSYEDVITLANIVKLFNPDVLGPAPVWTLHNYPITVNDTGFNLAVTGHNTVNFSIQARDMINTFKTYPGLNFKEDWKLVTILIGMNDICDYCKDRKLFTADNFIHYLTQSLDMMMNEVPRLIVNVVQIFTMKPLREVSKPTLGCLLQKSFCSCLVLPDENSTELAELVELNLVFQRKLEELLNSERFFKEDFAVVLQPFVTHAQPPRLPNGKIDLSFFTPDCFHFTIKGHEELAKGLWNNMFQPPDAKEMIDTFSEPVTLICPSEKHPYIYTRPNALSSASSLHIIWSLMTLTILLTIWSNLH
ncbi:phospholipase B1, membrane-associated-like [Astyanax mexicanus]|uniref:phospholipase B1, membrane-associated-like n=1 Tax=Astyanax mexicanus TaxID=7994 RepID=UPI0020CB0113|nr:phospholipase B1, membrane-associated-like [Astyanax mexicanus]